MLPSSHRIKTQEKKLIRKLFFTLGSLLAAAIFLLYIGLPIFAKLIVFVSSFRKSETTSISTTSLVLPPTFDPLPEATNSSRIVITGYGESESTIKILVNEKESEEVIVDKEGNFIAKNILLSEGVNKIAAKTIKENQESNLSEYLVITLKKDSPKLEISSPTEDEKFSADSKEIVITGDTDPGNKVTVNDRLAIVDTSGKFNFSVVLSDGENKFKIVASDNAGNQTVIERKVTYSS